MDYSPFLYGVVKIKFPILSVESPRGGYHEKTPAGAVSDIYYSGLSIYLRFMLYWNGFCDNIGISGVMHNKKVILIQIACIMTVYTVH